MTGSFTWPPCWKVRGFGLRLQGLRSEEVSAAESAADSPGSSSLSPRNPTPSQATRTEHGNVRNPVTHLLTASHVLTPIGRQPCHRPCRCDYLAPQGDLCEHERRARGGNKQRIKVIWLMGKGKLSSMALSWVCESSKIGLLSLCQHHKDHSLHFCHSLCRIKSISTRS